MNNVVLNMNDFVYVQILDGGWKYITQYHENIFQHYGELGQRYIKDGINIYKRRTNKYLVDGEWKELTKIQLHDFIELFGPTVQFGSLNDKFSNNIYLTVDESTKISNEFNE